VNTRAWAPATVAEPARAPDSSTGYIADLVEGLRAEAEHEELRLPAQLLSRFEAHPDDFALALGTYRSLRRHLAGGLDARYETAAGYGSMEEFWADAAAQEAGRSGAAFWDSYENGRRRRIEGQLANSFGVGEAVLVNSGMSAVDIVLRDLLQPGARLLVHDRMYFESDDLVSGIFERWGVRVARADLRDPDSIAAAIGTDPPVAALVEVALNGPGCDVPGLEALWDRGVITVVDTSALGSAVAGLTRHAPAETRFVESGTKYLTRQASVGVIYGWKGAAAARRCARRTGVQLQGRALHQLRPAELTHVGRRLAIHADRLRRFVDVLSDRAPEASVRTAVDGAADRRDLLARTVADGAAGCMAFLRLPQVGGEDLEQVYRTIVARWARRVPGRGRVRAGFGWSETTGRAYGRDALNASDGACFARFSVGIEPPDQVEDLADQLASTISEVCR